MAKEPKIRFSGYYPKEVVAAIKGLADRDRLSENEAATKLLEAGILAVMPVPDFTPGGIAKGPVRIKTNNPSGLKGIDLAVWKAEQKEKKP